MIKADLPPKVKESEIKKLEQELKRDIEEKGIRPLSVEQWAKEAGQHDIYLAAYAILCDQVHTNVKDLKRYLVLDDNNEIKQFNWGPDTDDLELVLSANIECMLRALKAICELFKIDKNKILNDIHNNLKVLVEQRRKAI